MSLLFLTFYELNTSVWHFGCGYLKKYFWLSYCMSMWIYKQHIHMISNYPTLWAMMSLELADYNDDQYHHIFVILQSEGQIIQIHG